MFRTGLFNDCYLPIMDGVTMTVRNYAFWIEKLLGPACVVTPYVPHYEDSEPSKVIRFMSVPTIVRPPYRIGLPDLDLRLQHLLKKRDFSIVHAHSPFAAGLLARKVARERGIPVIATFHSKYRKDFEQLTSFKPLIDDGIKRIVDFYYSVDEVWVPQKSVAATLREYGYKGACEVMENGIDMSALADAAPYRRRGSAYLGLPEGIPLGLFVGQHTVEKNLPFLMRTLPAVMAAVPDFTMAFVGKGYAKPQLQALAAEMGIADRVKFVDVIFDRELLQSIYARADIFLFPSFYDTWALVVREAAACGTPSICIRGSNAAECIDDGISGYLADNDVEAFSEKVIETLGNRSGLAEVAAAARKNLCRTWESVVCEVKDRYLRIIDRWER